MSRSRSRSKEKKQEQGRSRSAKHQNTILLLPIPNFHTSIDNPVSAPGDLSSTFPDVNPRPTTESYVDHRHGAVADESLGDWGVAEPWDGKGGDQRWRLAGGGKVNLRGSEAGGGGFFGRQGRGGEVQT